MTVVGFDPGLRATGYAVVRTGEAGPVLVEAGVIRARPDGPLEVRLEEIYTDARALLEEARPEVVVLEDVFSHLRFPRAGLRIGHVLGVLFLAAAHAGVRVASLPPAEVKRAITGNGRAPKAQVQATVCARLGFEGSLPHHAADAIALALALLGRLGERRA
ncbi:MAG: crossover junction endodeoxyribonuclease RuvC [Armatimonadetes bacterium]|nr:crossover junction endodeoxyribonuclease RuvC [Armatimonadota bacterium]MDW8154132.1 crossover junction endodeoxyribonuclease RuvC [Armatimonadota bacterium]